MIVSTSKNKWQNYLDESNHPIVISCTSESKGWPIKNLLNSQEKKIWLSQKGLPQSFTLNIGMLKNKAQFYQWFGIRCWYTYSSNPKEIDLYVSKDGVNYVTWANFHLKYVEGYQFFSIDPIGQRYKYIKIIIKDTFGSNQTYLNQVLLLEENPNSEVPVKLPKFSMFENDVHNKLNFIPESEESDEVQLSAILKIYCFSKKIVFFIKEIFIK